MALCCVVKVGNITNLSDARYSAGMGVEMLGFCVEKNNPNYVSPESYREIIRWISGVDCVLEMTDVSWQELSQILEEYPCNALEISNESLLETLVQKAEESEQLPVKLLWKVKDKEVFLQKAPQWKKWIYYFVFSKDNLVFCQKFAEKYPILLEGDFSVQEVKQILDKTALKGFALHGSAEIAPGLKDFDHLSEVLETLEIE